MNHIYFRVYLNEQRSIRVTAEIVEFEVHERTWLVRATAQLWRMTRMRGGGGHGELIGAGAIGDPVELSIRGQSVCDALQRLADTATERICNGLQTTH